jgi:hypothetical protein
LNTFRPVNDDHAITSVAVGLKLDEFVEPQTLQVLAQADVGWKKLLPAVLPAAPAVISGAAGQNLEIPSLQFAIVRPDARPIWSLRFNGFNVVVECTAYTRWADVWRRAKDMLEEAYRTVRMVQSDANIQEMTLQVNDSFLTDSDAYTAGELLVTGDLIGNRVLNGGGIWHVNTGWFADDGELRVLHGLNCSATRKPAGNSEPPPPFTTVSVMHLQRASHSSAAILEPARLDEIVCSMHEANKAEISRLLVPSMLAQIGLEK